MNLNIIFALLFASTVSIISYYFKLLTKSGAVSAFIIGSLIFSLGQFKWGIPLVTFFMFSSLLSRSGENHKKKFETIFYKSTQRDYGQVIANGGLGAILVISNLFIKNELPYLIYIGSISAVCADTCATEIGTMRNTDTYNILNFKKTKQGTSGGVSLAGSSGALLGAIIVAASALFWIHLNIIYYFCLIVFAGLSASFIDSILGAAFQSQNKCLVCGQITEKKVHCEKLTKHYKGLKFLNNDVINFLAALSGSIIVYFINEIAK